MTVALPRRAVLALGASDLAVAPSGLSAMRTPWSAASTAADLRRLVPDDLGQRLLRLSLQTAYKGRG